MQYKIAFGTTNCFNHGDVFPVIARVIKQRWERQRDFLTHDEIAQAFQEDDKGAHEIDMARGRCPARS